MRSVFILIALLAFSLTSFSQISPAIKAGIGYPYVLDEDESISPNVHTFTGYPTVSVEKPFPVTIRVRKRMSINPGLAYYYFNEEKVRSNIENGTSISLNLTHQSVSSYVKILYQAKIRGKTEAFVYMGGIGGINLLTKSKGNRYQNGLVEEIPEFEVQINENGSEFFGKFYYGALVGFQPNARKYNFIKPSFELAFYPAFITKTLEEVRNIKKDVSTIQFSVFFGFRIK